MPPNMQEVINLYYGSALSVASAGHRRAQEGQGAGQDAGLCPALV